MSFEKKKNRKSKTWPKLVWNFINFIIQIQSIRLDWIGLDLDEINAAAPEMQNAAVLFYAQKVMGISMNLNITINLIVNLRSAYYIDELTVTVC